MNIQLWLILIQILSNIILKNNIEAFNKRYLGMRSRLPHISTKKIKNTLKDIKLT